jgi:HlyD family secretion protein
MMSGSQLDIPSLHMSAARNTAQPELSDPSRAVDPNGGDPNRVDPNRVDPNAELNLPERLTAPRRGRSRWILALIAAALVAGGYYSYQSQRKPEHLYRSSPVERRAIRQTVEAFGSLDVLSRVYVPAARPGQLTSVLVHRGALVEAGQPLAKLDPTGATADLSAAQTAVGASAARVERARAARASATEERIRAEHLLERGLVSASAVAAARANEAEAAASLRAAEAQRDLDDQARDTARQRRDETTLRAPVAGFVLSASSDIGAMVGPQTGPLFVITPPLDDLLLTVPVSEADIGLVRVGQSATFSVSAHPEQRFPAQVDEIESEPQKTGSAVSYRVRLRVRNPDHLLLPGMTANVTLDIAEASEALAVREAALRFSPGESATDNGHPHVWREKPGGKLELVEVVPGISDGAYTAVTPAPGFELNAGDQVAVGFAGAARESSNGPGISLGNRK